MTKSELEKLLNEKRLRLILANTNDLVATIDLQGNFTYVSPSHKKVLGYSPKELLGVNSFSLIHPDDQELAMQELQKALSGKEQSLNSFRAKHKNGNWIVLEATASTVFNVDGKPNMFVAILRDITSRVEFERRKDEFVSILGHSLKTPLTCIHAYTEILEKELKGKDKSLYEYSQKLQEQTAELFGLIQSLIDVADTQLGSLKLDKKKFSLNKTVDRIVENFKDKVNNKIKVLHKDKIKINADKKRLEIVINALLSNAIKYSGPNTTVEIIISKNNGNAVVEVKDRGIGIPAGEQEKIFGKFYQIIDQKKFQRPGFGIGLFFARHIMQLHNGELRVKSKTGKGSTFYISLPIE